MLELVECNINMNRKPTNFLANLNKLSKKKKHEQGTTGSDSIGAVKRQRLLPRVFSSRERLENGHSFSTSSSLPKQKHSETFTVIKTAQSVDEKKLSSETYTILARRSGMSTVDLIPATRPLTSKFKGMTITLLNNNYMYNNFLPM